MRTETIYFLSYESQGQRFHTKKEGFSITEVIAKVRKEEKSDACMFHVSGKMPKVSSPTH